MNFCPKHFADRQGCNAEKGVWNAVPTPNKGKPIRLQELPH